MTETVIEIADLWKKYTLSPEHDLTLKNTIKNIFTKSKYDFYALKGINYKVNKGEMIGVIGSNGAGKTTLLKLLGKIIEPTRGNIKINGKVSTLLELGAGFHPELTGAENIFLNGAILRLKKDKIKSMFDEIVDFAELSQFINIPVKYYSSGMQMRLGFAIAVTVEHDILLVDEVLAVGDEAFMKKCFYKITEFKNKGKTIIFVSHNLNAVGEYCDRTIWIDGGEIKGEGESGKVIQEYLNFVGKKEKFEEVIVGLKNTWGTKEIEITDVSFYDSQGTKKNVFYTGEDIIVRYKYHTNKRIDKPVFGMAIHREDGIHIFGTNTKIENQMVEYVDRDGEIEYCIPNNPLNEGIYLFSADILDYELKKTFDKHNRLYRIKVLRGNKSPVAGTLNIPCRWKYYLTK
jgi:ABC-type polysaccharide/polyol phosphate transport system ATPase subunit